MKRKLSLSILIAVLLTLVVVGVASAMQMTVCRNVFHRGVKIMRICAVWPIVWRESPEDVKANSNGTHTVQYFVSGYTATFTAQWCQPLQTWTAEVHCRSRVALKEKGWPIGTVKYDCWYEEGIEGGQFCIIDLKEQAASVKVK